MNWQELLPELKKYLTEFGVHIISAIGNTLIWDFGFLKL